mgnify:CR=1 FL=1
MLRKEKCKAAALTCNDEKHVFFGTVTEFAARLGLCPFVNELDASGETSQMDDWDNCNNSRQVEGPDDDNDEAGGRE